MATNGTVLICQPQGDGPPASWRTWRNYVSSSPPATRKCSRTPSHRAIRSHNSMRFFHSWASFARRPRRGRSAVFPEDYSIVPPASRALGTLAEEIRVSKIFTLHALLALDEQQSDLALEDLKLNQKLALGAARDPTLVASLFGMGMTTVGGSAIFSGLAKHQWNDAQLAEIQRMLEQFDFSGDVSVCVSSGGGGLNHEHHLFSRRAAQRYVQTAWVCRHRG